MKKIVLILVIAFLMPISKNFAQQKNQQNQQKIYKGKIIDKNNNPIVGATIISIDNKNIGTASDLNGAFSIKLRNPKVTITTVGYQTKMLTLLNKLNTIQLVEDLESLEEVIVSANRIEQKRLEVPAAVGVLTAKQIKESKATQIDQLLNQMTGVFMSNLGNESHTMSIRSPLSYRSLFLFTQDGIPVRPTGNFSHTALKEMDQASFNRIEVIRGANSAVYGSEAIGGVINAITMRPTEDVAGKISFQANDIGYKRTEFNISNTVGKIGFFAGGHYGSLKNGWRDHSDLDKIGTTFKLTYKATDKLDFSLTYNYTYIDSERTGNLGKEAFEGGNITSLHTFTNSRTIAKRTNFFTNYQWNDNNFTKFILFHRNIENGGIPHFRIRNNRKNPLKASGQITSSTLKSYGTLLQHTLKINFLDTRLVFGGSVDFSPTTSKKKRIDITRNSTGKYVSFTDLNKVFEDWEVDYYNYASFMQFDLSPIKNLKLSGALRYDYFKYDYNSTEELTFLAGITNDKVSFNNVTPKIGITYDFKNNKGVYTNYSLGFVPPQMREVYGADVINRAIEPQRFNNYEIGGWASFLNKKGYVDVAFYKLIGENEVVKVVLADGSEENRNVGKTSHKGIELGLRYQLNHDLKFRFNGTYAEHKYDDFNTGEKDFSGNFMQRAPKWIWNTALNYEPNYLKGFRIGLEYQHLGKYYQSPINNEKLTYPGFNLFHLRTGYEFTKKLKGVELWLNVLNLTDKKYAEISDVSSYSGKQRFRPGNPRNFTIGLQYNF
ncbi:TonB-dependent receptor [Tenacibaculum finnmarkense]|uniref:TonB-dependent receptor n=1 Tax=Tenacibaculum finnmarkense TaxID=2781243 RepID=UPI003BB75AE6